MIPKNLHLQRISLPEFGLAAPMLSSLSREEFLNRLSQQDDLECFGTCTLKFDDQRRLTIDCPMRAPSEDFARRLMDEVFRHFCTGSYWFFGGVLTLLEKRANGGPEVELDMENYVQMLAVLATLHDPESNPVVLYPVDSLV
jgi:hypothetical protein